MVPLLIANAFGLTVKLVYQALPATVQRPSVVQCDAQQFYLAIPQVANFLVLPEKNHILIEKINPGLSEDILHTWLYGTVFAYILQYHGYIVLHGSAVLMGDHAVIFSGQSGAGKSTLANALVQKGYRFITDDLVVIKRNEQGQHCVIPGPSQLKLWQDTMQHFDYDINNATPISLKVSKYAVRVTNPCPQDLIPISAFYELNTNPATKTYHCEKLIAPESLKILMQNAYRYFMLKPLGKLPHFFYNCSALTQQSAVYKLTRTSDFSMLSQMVKRIELQQGISL